MSTDFDYFTAMEKRGNIVARFIEVGLADRTIPIQYIDDDKRAAELRYRRVQFIAALRSGKFTQISGALSSTGDAWALQAGNVGFCCIGVGLGCLAPDGYGGDWIDDMIHRYDNHEENREYSTEINHDSPYEDFMAFFDVTIRQMNYLMALNDGDMYVNTDRLCSNSNSPDEFVRGSSRFIARFPNHGGVSGKSKRCRDFLFIARFLEIMWGLNA